MRSGTAGRLAAGFRAGAALWATAAPAWAGPAIPIQPKYVVGLTYYVEVEQRIRQTMKSSQIPGGRMDRDFYKLSGVIEKVESTGPNVSRLSLTFDRIRQSMDTGMEKAQFDSDDADAPETSPFLAAALGAMLGGRLEMEVGATGRVVALTGMQQIAERIASKVERNDFARSLQGELTDDRARVVWGDQMLVFYPFSEKKPGDTWQARLEDEFPMVGRVVTTYNFRFDRYSEEKGRKAAVIEYTGQKARDAVAFRPADSVKVEIDSNFTGTALFDVELGRIVERSQVETTTVRFEQPTADPTKPDKAALEAAVKQSVRVLPLEEREKQKAESRRKAEERRRAGPTSRSANPNPPF